MCTLIPKNYAIMNTLPTNVLYDIYCPKSDGSVREAQKKGGENSPISPPLDPQQQRIASLFVRQVGKYLD